MQLNIPGTEILGLIMLLVPPVFAADYRQVFSVHSFSELQGGTPALGVSKPQ